MDNAGLASSPTQPYTPGLHAPCQHRVIIDIVPIVTTWQFVCIQVAAFDPTDHCTEVNSAVFGDFTCCQRLFFPHSNLSIGNYTQSSIDSLLRLQG